MSFENEPDDLLRALEAALFASTEPMTVAQLRQLLGDAPDLPERLAALADDYAGRGINLVERGGRWHFQTAPDMAHLLRRDREDPRKLSRAGMETLAIIAYHEPVSRAEIEAIRGVRTGPLLRALLDRKLIQVVGRAEVPGAPLQYGTTPRFLVRFGLKDIADLPSLKEFRQGRI